MAANQIVKRSGAGVGGWMLSLSVPESSFKPGICWWDLQPLLLTENPPKGRSCLVAVSVLPKPQNTGFVTVLHP